MRIEELIAAVDLTNVCIPVGTRARMMKANLADVQSTRGSMTQGMRQVRARACACACATHVCVSIYDVCDVCVCACARMCVCVRACVGHDLRRTSSAPSPLHAGVGFAADHHEWPGVLQGPTRRNTPTHTSHPTATCNVSPPPARRARCRC